MNLALKNPLKVLGFYVFAVALAAPGLFRLRIDNDVERFFVEDSQAIRGYRQFQRDFGPDRAGRIVLRGSTLWTTESLAWLAKIESELGQVDAVLGAAGLYHHHRLSLSQWPPPDPAAFRNLVSSDPLDRAAGFVSSDGEVITVLFALYQVVPQERRAALGRVRSLLESRPPGIDADLAGLPVLVDSVERAILEWSARFLPWLLGAALLLLWLVFRRLAHVLIPLLFVAVIEVLVLGGLGYLRVAIDLITVLLIPLLFVISLATAVHVLVRFRHHLSLAPPNDALSRTYREKGWPVFWTGLTTFVGFASVALSDVPPLRSLGISVGVGIGLMTLSMFLLYPLLLIAPRRITETFRPGALERLGRRWGRKLTLAAVDRRLWVQSAFLLVALIAAWGLLRLHVQTSVLEYFPADSSERRSHELLEREGIAPVSIDLILSGRGTELPFASAEALKELGTLAREIRGLEPTMEVVSAASLLESLGRGETSGQFPSSGEIDWDAALRKAARNRDMERLLGSLRTPSGSRARVSILLPFLGLQQIQPLLERARQAAARLFPGAESLLTGQYLLVILSQSRLLPTMLWSFSLTLLLISLVFWFLTRSLRLWVISLLPNLWPVLFVLGVMGWSGIPLDSTTVAIAAIMLGLAVDDTLHTLGYYRASAIHDPTQRVAATLEKAAGAHILTSLVLAAGFAICGFSSFLPVGRFGWLAAITVVAALLADLFLFPVLLAALPSPSNHGASE